jgi:hypothetical protein
MGLETAMRRLIANLAIWLLCACPASAEAAETVPLGTPVSAEQSASRPMDSQGMDAVHQYSENVGREVLKEELGVDLNALRFQFNPRTLRLEKIDQGGPARPSVQPTSNADLRGIPHDDLAADEPVSSKLSLTVDQRGDLLRIRNDNRDLPFGVELNSEVPILRRLTALETKIWVPFSWRDEIKASAVVPLKRLKLGVTDGLLRKLDLNDRLDLRSDFSNRLGVNQLDAGLGTQWNSRYMGLMDLDYDYSQRSGQGLEETTHWLKLRKDF